MSVRFPGLMPWHFGGDDVLTFAEQDEYVRAHNDAARAEEKARRGQQRRR